MPTIHLDKLSGRAFVRSLDQLSSDQLSSWRRATMTDLGEARSMEKVIAELTARLDQLPPHNPRRSRLAELIQRLKEEIGLLRASRHSLKTGPW